MIQLDKAVFPVDFDRMERMPHQRPRTEAERREALARFKTGSEQRRLAQQAARQDSSAERLDHSVPVPLTVPLGRESARG